MLGKIIRGWNEMSTYRKIRRVFMIGLAGFGLWALTPYLYNRRVDEAFPVAAPVNQAALIETAAPALVDTVAPAAQVAPTATSAMADTVAPTAAAPTAAMADAAAMTEKTVPTAVAAPTATPALADTVAPTVVAPTVVQTGPVALSTGTFIAGSTPGDQAGGKATIYQLEDGKSLLRLEDFSTTNGPDLFVVLSSSANPDQDGLKNGKYLQLDALKGNLGNQNYELPADVDLSQYKSVVIWCRAFNIVFGYAELQSAS